MNTVKIYLGGIGGAPSNNFVRSLKEKGNKYSIIGGSSSASDLFLADANKVFLVPRASDPEYSNRLLSILNQEKPDLMHAQHDFEIETISALRDQIHECGVKTFLPSRESIDTCVDKFKSYKKWEIANIQVPKTYLLNDESDLKKAFKDLGPKIWIRKSRGAAGAGSLPTEQYDFAVHWLNHYSGWGEFTAAELLTAQTVTWSSIWYHGELIVAQSRRRLGWHSSDRAISGVTGMTAVGETCSDALVDSVSEQAVKAIDSSPHGIFSVDMTYDNQGIPNPTEINIGRFFTTHHFFTKAGLNMPDIFCDLCLYGKKPDLKSVYNPLPDGQVWIRGMDREAVLIQREQLEDLIAKGYKEDANDFK